MNTMIIDHGSYEVLATLMRYGRSRCEQDLREYYRLKQALLMNYSDCRKKIIWEENDG